MKLYHELTVIGGFPNILRKAGDGYFLVIDGVNVYVNEGKIVVDPVYVPFFRYQKSAGQIVLDLNFWRTKARRFIFQLRSPFVSTFMLEGLEYDYSEDE